MTYFNSLDKETGRKQCKKIMLDRQEVAGSTPVQPTEEFRM